MSETLDSLNEKILILQNALIRQRVDQVKLQNDVEDFSERSSFYESLYNKARHEFYELEIMYKNVLMENENLKRNGLSFSTDEDTCKKNVFDKNNIENLGSIELLKIVLKRLKAKIRGKKYEFN